jgi:hypothetical protein
VFTALRRGASLDFLIDNKLVHSVEFGGEMGAVGFAPRKGTMRIYAFGASEMHPHKVGETWKGWTGRAASKPITVDIAAGRQADRPAHESLSAYQGGERNWFNAVSPIVRSTNGIPDLIRELSCTDAKHRDLANEVLRQVYSDVHPQSPTTPTNSAAWTTWWEQAGKTNSAQQLWHNFDSHYQ